MNPAKIAMWAVTFGVVVAAFVTLETIGPAPAPKNEEPALKPHQGPPPIVRRQ